MFPTPRAPVKRIPLVAGLHCIVAVPRFRGLTPRICTPDEISPRRRLFWVTTTTFFFSFPDFSGARSITSSRSNSAPARVDSRRTLLFSALLSVCRSRAIILQPGKIQIHINHFSVPCLQRISSRVPFISGTGGPVTLRTAPLNGPVRTFNRDEAEISLRKRTQTRIVASACSAPAANSSRPLIPLTSAQMVFPSSQFSTGWPEGVLVVVKFWMVTRCRNRPACIIPPLKYHKFCKAGEVTRQ